MRCTPELRKGHSLSTLSDTDLDAVYTDFCKTMTLVGEANAQQFLARFSLLAISHIGNREVICGLIAAAADDSATAKT